eukprot:2814333-Prymnesium_polylepis.1
MRTCQLWEGTCGRATGGQVSPPYELVAAMIFEVKFGNSFILAGTQEGTVPHQDKSARIPWPL